ncbi:hypothetical protein GCM10011362_20170 [Marinobacter halophilus]|uniref:Uncharacterized protein n=1 Tax=Marinobacter halophilus TaxID=1323740 RepID=A0A2T1K880_9GAMM|nr:hypothetical protein C7H08_14500 [Marinobacter halophilus]GGC71617.1 hypothetical protein GCM10011362_20170 [Marinobacter halophilus]
MCLHGLFTLWYSVQQAVWQTIGRLDADADASRKVGPEIKPVTIGVELNKTPLIPETQQGY